MLNSDIIDALNHKEIYRYLGYQKNTPDTQILQMIDDVLIELKKNINPKNIYKIYSCNVDGDKISLLTDGELIAKFESTGLAGNLKQCKKVVLFAATLGIEIDKLINKYEIINIAKASVVQSCAAACIEKYCDMIQEDIKIKAKDEQLYVRPRFSPGYGDLTLMAQKDIFRILECTKRMGLTLTQSLMMYPTKSVTAFIGLTPNPQSCHVDKCKICRNIGCEFRNE